MSRLDRRLGWRWRRLLIGLVVFFGFLALVSWAGFFLFSPISNKFTGEGVKVEIEGPPQINSGELIKYIITVKNDESVPLGTASLDLRLPNEFTVKEIHPKPEAEGLSWQLGSLFPNSEKTFKISGIFLAPLETQLDIQAILNYRPADFNSKFQKVATRTIGVSDSIFELTIFGPERVMPGDKVNIDIAYLNTTDNAFNDFKLKTLWPTGFIPETTNPKAINQEMSEWEVKELPANAEGRIKISGYFASDVKGEVNFIAYLGLIGDQGAFGQQKEATYQIDVVEGQLIVSLVLNGKSTDQPVSFGDLLHYSLSWQNTGSSTLDDVTLTATVEASPRADVVDWNDLRDEQEGERTESQLSWNMKQVSALEHIASGEEGTIDFTLPLISQPFVGISDTNYEVIARVEAIINAIDGQEVNRKVTTPPLKATISSDARFAAEARWFNSDCLPVGSGPLPPEVGQTTTYRVNWLIANTLHDLSDLKLSARLPDNVIWTGKSSVDAGDIRFDAAESRIIWTLNWMPTDVETLQIGFDVAITPTANQQGKSPTLVDAVIFEARDKENTNPIILSAPPTTTAIPDDSFAGGKGKVK